MKKQRTDGQETRQKLLAAASEVFAEKGFWETTNADICETAKVNTAAVNYHFGSKENLYVEAWKSSFESSIAAHPLDGGIAPDAPVGQRLRGRILTFMHRIADPNNYEIDIMHKEMANPTGLLTEVIRQATEPMWQDMRSIVHELLGDGASEQQISFCAISLIGQCFGPMLHLRQHAKMARGTPPPPGPPFEFGVEELADHITRFSLAGIRGIREEAGKGQKAGKKRRQSSDTSKRE